MACAHIGFFPLALGRDRWVGFCVDCGQQVVIPDPIGAAIQVAPQPDRTGDFPQPTFIALEDGSFNPDQPWEDDPWANRRSDDAWPWEEFRRPQWDQVDF